MIKSTASRQILVSMLISGVFVALMVVSLYRGYQYVPSQYQLDEASRVDEFLNENWSKQHSSQVSLKKIPTGLFIESLSFMDASTVHISGYVWQHYPNKNFDAENSGVVFPEAINLKFKKAYERIQADKRVIGWYFEGEFVQKFDYSRYPFDFKVVWLRLWHKQFDSNIVLSPDLPSYDAEKISNIFAIDSDIVLKHYILIDSYFDYNLANYDTDFGIQSYIGKHNFPELRFNVVLKRHTLRAVIVNLIPLFMVIVIAFFTSLSATANKDKILRLGSHYLNILRCVAFLLFVIVIAHVQLRNKIFGHGIVFLDYIYFIVYFSLLYIVGLTYMTTRDDIKSRLFLKLSANDFRLPKLFFFPLVLGMTLYQCLSLFSS